MGHDGGPGAPAIVRRRNPAIVLGTDRVSTEYEPAMEATMSEQTPSQAEGERDDDTDAGNGTEGPADREVPRTTPSQAEGDDVEEQATEGDDEDSTA